MPNTSARLLVLLLAGLLIPAACSTQPAVQPATNEPPPLVAESANARDEAGRNVANTWTGDFDGMVERRIVRVLVVYNRMGYFIDKGEPHGTAFEAMREFEQVINRNLGNSTLKVFVIFIPVRRDRILEMLAQGRGDVALANLTVTPEREKFVDFTNPVSTDVRELVVTGPGAPEITSVDDLSGKDVFVRRSSSYNEHLRALNERLEREGKPPANLRDVDEQLETEDILEMVNAGLYPITVADAHLADFWKDVLPGIRGHDDVAVSSGERIAWAIRKDSPKLMESLNSFIADHGVGTSFGNTVVKRYWHDNVWVKNATSAEEMRKFNELVEILKKRAREQKFDYLMIAAQAYQESGLDQSARSPAGAVGVMQIKPSTAASPEVGISGVETSADRNVAAGVKYLRYMVDVYFKDDPMDDLNRHLFAFAAYNAGPARFPAMRKEAAERGYDPNVWFQNVEVIVSERIGREPVTYVSNIYKYYTAYKLASEIVNERRTTREAVRKGDTK